MSLTGSYTEDEFFSTNQAEHRISFISVNVGIFTFLLAHTFTFLKVSVVDLKLFCIDVSKPFASFLIDCVLDQNPNFTYRSVLIQRRNVSARSLPYAQVFVSIF